MMLSIKNCVGTFLLFLGSQPLLSAAELDPGAKADEMLTSMYDDKHYVDINNINDIEANRSIPIPLWPNQVPGERPNAFGNETWRCNPSEKTVPCVLRNITTPMMYPYLVKDSDAAMIIAPGGGYNVLVMDKEGTDIASWLNSIGISAFVLKYRVPDRHWLPFGTAALMDAQRAMGMVRHMADGHSDLVPNLNASKIGFMGFSAGGHLTGHINVAWANRTYPNADDADLEPCRPDFSIMVYPWRSVSQPPVNEPISGASALNVTNTTPPTMLIQTEDDYVHVENSIYYYLALKQKGAAPSELHVYPHGGHGYARCVMEDAAIHKHEVCTWPDRAQTFLTTLGVIAKEERDEGFRSSPQ